MQFFQKNNYFFIETAYQINFYTVSEISNKKMTVWGIIISAENSLPKIFTADFSDTEKKISFFIVFSLTIYIMNGKIVAFATVAFATK